MKFLVTGATGKLGSKVVEALLQSVAPENLAVSVRDPEKASALRARGVDIRQADFDEPASLDAAFEGVNRLLIISPSGDNDTRIRRFMNVVPAAERAGVEFIAYTSIAKADTDKPLLWAPSHRFCEEAILKTGIPYSFLRNNWYIENEADVVKRVLSGLPLVASSEDGKVGWATRDDYAQAAAAVLAGSGHENTIYELSGPLRTYADLAELIGQALGRTVPVHLVDDAAYADFLIQAGVPKQSIPYYTSVQKAIREGALAVESNDLATLLGRPVTPLTDAIRLIKASASA